MGDYHTEVTDIQEVRQLHVTKGWVIVIKRKQLATGHEFQ
jgi:hypothetical protein